MIVLLLVYFMLFQVQFAGFMISCKTSLYNSNPFKWLYNCECTDEKTKVMLKCKKHQSPEKTCKRALTQLLITMSALKHYPEPCDPADMPTDC